MRHTLKNVQINYEYLCDDLRFLEFNLPSFYPLEQKIGNNRSPFDFKFTTEVDGKRVNSVLTLRKPLYYEFFFIEDYRLALAAKQHWFNNPTIQGLTLRQAFNLISGRAVLRTRFPKTAEKYIARAQLDLKSRSAEDFELIKIPGSGSFNPSAGINTLSIRPLSHDWDYKKFIRSLEQRNLQVALQKQNGIMKKIFIAAKPAAKAINIYE